MRYARAALLAVLLLVLVPWGGPSSAGTTIGTTALGTMTRDVLVVDEYGIDRLTASEPINDATTKDDGELHLSGAWLAPPLGQRFVAGTTYDVAAERGAAIGSLGNVCRTYFGQTAAVKSGTLTIDDVRYDGDTVAVLAASWSALCAGSTGPTTSQGFVRLASDAQHPLVTAAPVELPQAGRSKPVQAPVTFTNTGTGATGVLGSATVDPAVTGGQYYRISTDRCAGTALAPGESCTVDVVFERNVVGNAQARIAVPAPGYPGGRILAAVEGDVVTAPTEPAVVKPFPVLAGLGVSWSADWRAAWFQVERRDAGGSWRDASGRLRIHARTWVDPTLAVGATAEYRVLSGNPDGEAPPSAPVPATRAAAAATGSVQAVSIDADGGKAPVGDQLVTDFVERQQVDTYDRQLAIGSLQVSFTDVLPGPGEYAVAPGGAYSLTIQQASGICRLAGRLRVDQLAYSDTLRPIAALAATADGVCRTADGDSPRVVVELRVNSATPLKAVALSPADAGKIAVGSQSEARPVTIKNTGTAQLELGRPSVVGPTAADWTITGDDCPAVFAAGATCTVDVVASPAASGLRTARLELKDSTTRGVHHAALTVTGLGVPGAPRNLKALATFTGVDLAWDVPSGNGGSEVTGYTVHRIAGGVESTFDVERISDAITSRWVDVNPPAGATYAVSARNAQGDGAATTAQAPRHTSDVLTFSDGSLHQLALPDGSQPVPLGLGTPAQDVIAVTASADGRQLAYGAEGGLWTVRADSPAAAAPVKVATANVLDIAFSPDRTRLAYTEMSGTDRCVWLVSATGGTPVKVRCDVQQPTWHPDSQSLVVVGGGAVQRVQAKADGAVLETYAGTSGASAPAVSPDGRWIAFAQWPAVPQVKLIPLAGGTPRTVTVPDPILTMSWAPSADRLIFASGGPGVGTIPVSPTGALGPAGPLYSQWVEGIRAPIWQGRGIAIAPTAARTGRAISIPFDLSPLATGTTATCRLDAGAWAPCTTSYQASGLGGGDHMVTVKATEPSGRTVVAARSFSVDATGPVSQVVSPSFATTTAGAAVLSYSATDSVGASSYDVRYRKASYLSGFGAYVQPWTGTTATSVNLPLDAGYEYCVSVRAKDKLGNLGAWSAEKCFSRPVDDRAMGAPTAGWSRTSWSEFYLGTATQTTAYGASLTRTVQGKRFFLVATKCPTCGLVAVYAGGKYIGAVNLASATTQRQAIVALPVQSAVFSGTLTFTVRSATGKFVQIDGLAVRRT